LNSTSWLGARSLLFLRHAGEWLKDVKHGEGAYITKDGDIYSGSWWKGMKHGRGTYVYKKDQSQLIGKWVQNKFKEGQWAFKDGTVYSGRFVQNHPIGRGTFKFPNGNEQDGEFVTVGQSKKNRKIVWKPSVVRKC